VNAFGPYQATVVNVHDGDTFDVDIVLVRDRRHRHAPDTDLGFDLHERDRVGLVLERQPVRLAGCNAPELATPAGKRALAFLESLLQVGDVVTLVSSRWDKYAPRIDGHVRLSDGRDLAEVMIAAGHAIVWDGQGPKPVPAA
jgi:endonuclease YncB( thermonuclease family)